MSDAATADTAETARFYEKLEAAGIRGQWQSESVRRSGAGGVVYDAAGSFAPQVGGAAHLWPWSLTRDLMEQSCRVVPESLAARRALGLNNPGLPSGATRTITMALQMIRPGELAWAHRHSMAALRFVIEGSSALRTVVDGESCVMEPYDLVLTPAWHWHDHRNAGTTPAAWLDVLDVPLVSALNGLFYDPFGEEQQPLINRAGIGSGRMAPPAEVMRGTAPARLRFAWREIEPLLRAVPDGAGSRYDGALLHYLQPDGGSTLPSLGCSIQRLRSGEATARHRHSSSAVYFVVRGSGRSEIGEQSLAWRQHDCFVLPNWAWHSHANQSASDDAVLFSVSDMPLLRYLGLYREEPEVSIRDAFPAPAHLVEPAFIAFAEQRGTP